MYEAINSSTSAFRDSRKAAHVPAHGASEDHYTLGTLKALKHAIDASMLKPGNFDMLNHIGPIGSRSRPNRHRDGLPYRHALDRGHSAHVRHMKLGLPA
uniref:Uncharacterized protein n=1 Tax=Cannabis sativa TaxID=3483 RepID=A0A803QRI9_CANSA